MYFLFLINSPIYSNVLTINTINLKTHPKGAFFVTYHSTTNMLIHANSIGTVVLSFNVPYHSTTVPHYHSTTLPS